jgi:hypothetical protein
MSEEQIVKTIKELLGEDPNISLDCTGVEQCVRVALQVKNCCLFNEFTCTVGLKKKRELSEKVL